MALISFRKLLFAAVCATLLSPAYAGYYLEYMRDPCIEYEACGGPNRTAYVPSRHHNKHYKRHTKKYHHRPRSSYSISVSYYWTVYPVYRCQDTCSPCSPARQWVTCSNGCNSCGCAQRGRYRETYYSGYNDIDYDTATADDGYRPCSEY